MNEQIVILDFGSQYTQVIARRIRECNVYSQILRFDTPAKEIAALKPRGIILSGGPSSVYARNAPLPDKKIFELGVPLLGIIPNLSHVDDDDKHQLAIRSKATPGVEAFLSVYSAVKVQSKLDYPKTMLVTSTIPGEGKTLVSCNLAGCFARHGRTTLLVDCDMRRPMLHRHFKLPNDAGILAWTEAGASLEGDLLANPELGITPITENLWLLRSGGRSKSPTEFLEQPIFGQLIDRLKKRFELIVIDSPPVGAVSDSLLIAERTDEVIYVCRFNRAARKHIKQFVRARRDGKNEFLGIVLYGLSPRRIEYYTNYRYYRSYKKYYGAQT